MNSIMKPSILVLDDQKVQATALHKAIERAHPEYHVASAYEAEDMLAKIETIYYHIAIVDLQMESETTKEFDEIDGIFLIHKILKINPLVKIIILSGHFETYSSQIKEIFQTGRVIEMVDKQIVGNDYNKRIIDAIDIEIDKQKNDSDIIKQILTNSYADAKNEASNYEKGLKFENFVATLFGHIGFKNMKRRVIDKSRNEVDIIIRNEIDDLFFQKFKPYILIECKNEQEKADKNTFIQFYSKLENTSSL